MSAEADAATVPGDDGTALPPEPETEEQAALRMLTETCDSKVQESLDATRRMLTNCEEAKEAGLKSLVNLDEQGEQLEAINKAMNQINDDMRAAEKNLQDMEKCCGLCVLPWNKAKSFENDPGYKELWGEGKEDGVNAGGPRPMVGEQMQIGGTYITRITNDAREDEMEQNMEEVNNMVSNLRNMAVDMGTEIETQNNMLDKIKLKAESNDARVREANKRAEKML